MAEKFDPIFEIDASVILAKLHLAAQQQVPNAVIINTGIKNPVDSPDPNNPGKTTFDLENKTGIYELAVLRDVQLYPLIKPEENEKLVKLENELSINTAAKDGEESKESDKNTEAKTTASNDDKSTNSLTQTGAAHANESKKTYNKMLKTLFENNNFLTDSSYLLEDTNTEEDTKEDTKTKEIDNKTKKKIEELIEVYKSYGVNFNKNEDDINITRKSFYDAIDKENKDRIENSKDSRAAKIEEAKKDATNDLYTFFTTFAGKDNVKKINPKDVAFKLISSESIDKIKPSSFDKIKDYKITADDVIEEINKIEDEKNKKVEETLKAYKYAAALIVRYQIDVD